MKWLSIRLKMACHEGPGPRSRASPKKALDGCPPGSQGQGRVPCGADIKGLVPGTKPFKLVFTQREFSQGLIP